MTSMLSMMRWRLCRSHTGSGAAYKDSLHVLPWPSDQRTPRGQRRSPARSASRRRWSPDRHNGDMSAFAAPSDAGPPTVLVLGGGGLLGEAWMTGVLGGYEDSTGTDLRGCRRIVGTSAGSIVAA